MEFFFTKGVASATRRSYSVAWNRYSKFCRKEGRNPVSALAVEGLAPPTLKGYLAGVRYAQVKGGWPDPCWGSMPRLGQVLKGIRRHRAEEGAPAMERKPVTPEVLEKLKGSWQKNPGFDSTMLWAAVCICYFRCCRAGEILALERGPFIPGVHLTFRDVVVDDLDKPRRIKVRIKASKTDPFRKGVDVHLGWTGQSLCPVSALLAYMVRKKEGQGPLFRFVDGRPLTRPLLVEAVRVALENVGASSAGISGHSFRIGAATAAAEGGAEDSIIKDLGRWKSNAFLRYVRRDRSKLAEMSKVLAGKHAPVRSREEKSSVKS